MNTFLLYDEARQIILRTVPSMGVESVMLEEALGRVLAEPITAREDLPGFDRASMDGFAVRVAGGEGRKTRTVVGELQAGSVYSGKIDEQSALRIMTGAPIPAGADAVVELERVEEQGTLIRFDPGVHPGRNIRPKGEDVRFGERVIEAGTLLRASHIGLLASLGHSAVNVSQRPAVALFVTGSELQRVDQATEPGKIRESNSWMLRAAIASLGLPLTTVETIPDDPELMTRALEKALSSDVVVISGGISAGKYDFTLEAFRRAHVELEFWKVRMKPGMPFAFGVGHQENRRIPVFGLPGNPVSTALSFRLLVLPALDRMQGNAGGEPPFELKARLRVPLTKSDDKRHFLRGIVYRDQTAEPLTSQSSGALSSLVHSNCLIVLPEEKKEFNAGDDVEILFHETSWDRSCL